MRNIEAAEKEMSLLRTEVNYWKHHAHQLERENRRLVEAAKALLSSMSDGFLSPEEEVLAEAAAEAERQ